MKTLKSLILLGLMSVCTLTWGQIDFNDERTIAKYIDSVCDSTMTQRVCMYKMIMAADNVLAQARTDFETYKSAYQYLIRGFSEMNASVVVDHLTWLPYLESVGATDEQIRGMQALADTYKRVRLGSKAPDIHAVTVYGQEFDMKDFETKYTLVLFWSHTCPHCRDMMKQLRKLLAGRDDITLVTVSVAKEVKATKRFLCRTRMKKKGYHICDGHSWFTPLVEAYNVDMTPTMFLVGKDGVLVAKPLEVEELIANLER